MSVPRKFSEKIAIQKQKAAEQEEAFASIMREVTSARHQNIPSHNIRRGMPSNMMYKGGSLPAFPTPHPEVQSPVREIVNDLSSTYPGRAFYDDQNYRPRANHGRVLHRPKARADTSPYHLPQYQTLQETGMWRRTYSDPSIGPMPRGSPSPKVSPKEPKSPQPTVKSADGNQVFGSPVMHDRKHHHMKIQSSPGSLPDVANLCIDIPISSEVEENMMKNQHTNNHVKFTVPTVLPMRRNLNLNTGKQVFPRQFSNPESKDMMSKEQQRFLINQLSQELQGSSLHSPTSPGSTMPAFGSMSPLAFEAVYPPNSMANSLPPNLNASVFEQEQYLNLIRMNELMYEQSNKSLPPRYEDSQQPQPISALQANVPNKIINVRSINQNLTGNEFANQFRMGITGNEEQKDDISDDILNNIRIGLDPLNFEDYQLLANSNLEVADQSVEEQFRQDRINFP